MTLLMASHEVAVMWRGRLSVPVFRKEALYNASMQDDQSMVVITGNFKTGSSRNNDYDICDSFSHSADGSLVLSVFLL